MYRVFFWLLIIAGIAAFQVQSQAQPMPAFFKKGSSTAFVWKPPSGSQCKFQCKRRFIGDWSSSDWNLYLQLWVEANQRGYINAFATEHNYDCNGRPCIFHNSKMLPPWHRIFLAHYEQILQNIDHQINPGRALISGEFCMGYWEWGYQVPFSNNFQDTVYSYLFNAGAMGSLPSGYNNIPDGKLQNAQCNGEYLTRSPSLGSDNWGTSAIASCLLLKDIEGNGDSSVGFRPCLEYNAHNSVHNNLGGTFSSFRSPEDPLFFLHHGMIDYVFWLWQQSNGNIISSTWSVPLVRPYNGSGWTTQQSLSYSSLCYTYVKPNQVTAAANPPAPLAPLSPPIVGRKLTQKLKQSLDNSTGRRVGRKLTGSAPIMEVMSTASNLSTDVTKLTPIQQLVVKKILNASKPMAIPLDKFPFLTMHASSPQEVEQNYINHVKAVEQAQIFYNAIKTYFQPTKASIQDPTTNSFSTEFKQDIAEKLGALTMGT